MAGCAGAVGTTGVNEGTTGPGEAGITVVCVGDTIKGVTVGAAVLDACAVGVTTLGVGFEPATGGVAG